MMIPQEITSHVWTKNWSAHWCAAFASLYCLYTTSLKPYTGRNLAFTLLVCDPESSSNYLAQQDIDSYGTYVAELVMKDHSFAEKMAGDTIASAHKIVELLETMHDAPELTSTSILELKKRFYEHIPPHFSMKKVIDYLPASLRKKFSPLLIEARIKTEHLFNNVDETLKNAASMIAKKSGLQEHLADFLTIDEMAGYLSALPLPSKDELTQRSKGFAIFCKGSDVLFFAGAAFTHIQKVLIGENKTHLTGTIAYKGLARGTARIVFDPSTANEFNEGDILVTGMTRPEFLPLMQKAAAFVTDAGGMLSHAAIVARELKKPCILATEKATKVIREGEEIEVDANKGIVRILRSSSLIPPK